MLLAGRRQVFLELAKEGVLLRRADMFQHANDNDANKDVIDLSVILKAEADQMAQPFGLGAFAGIFYLFGRQGHGGDMHPVITRQRRRHGGAGKIGAGVLVQKQLVHIRRQVGMHFDVTPRNMQRIVLCNAAKRGARTGRCQHISAKSMVTHIACHQAQDPFRSPCATVRLSSM